VVTSGELAWEVFKGLGSMAGLATGAFVIWDRFWRHFPIAVIVPRPLMHGSNNTVARLAVKNLASRPILITWENGTASHFRIAKDDTIHSVVSSLFPGRRTVALDVNEIRELELLRPANYEEIEHDDWLHLTLLWKFAQPIVWQPERNIRVAIKKSDYLLLNGGSAIDDEL
jgi:hypothetical protein